MKSVSSCPCDLGSLRDVDVPAHELCRDDPFQRRGDQSHPGLAPDCGSELSYGILLADMLCRSICPLYLPTCLQRTGTSKRGRTGSLSFRVSASQSHIVKSDLSHQQRQIPQHGLCRDRKYSEQHHTLRRHPRYGKEIVQIDAAEQKPQDTASQDTRPDFVHRRADLIQDHEHDGGQAEQEGEF